ncbi:hypothetical protein D3C75_1034870 [compost metagenome]
MGLGLAALQCQFLVLQVELTLLLYLDLFCQRTCLCLQLGAANKQVALRCQLFQAFQGQALVGLGLPLFAGMVQVCGGSQVFLLQALQFKLPLLLLFKLLEPGLFVLE